jgi:hypothetical protein
VKIFFKAVDLNSLLKVRNQLTVKYYMEHSISAPQHWGDFILPSHSGHLDI